MILILFHFLCFFSFLFYSFIFILQINVPANLCFKFISFNAIQNKIKKYFMLYYLILTLQAVTEIPTDFGFDNSGNLKAKIQKRIIKQSDGIILRAGADGGSVITFTESYLHENFSFEFNFNLPVLEYPEKASIFFWFTETPVTDFDGKLASYHGILSEVTFIGKTVKLGLSAILDKVNDKNYQTFVAVDSVSPNLTENLKNVKVKVIITDKNLKIELYNDDILVYDKFKTTDEHFIAASKLGKYFSITTLYDAVPLSKHFILKNVKLLKRTESKDYDPEHSNMEINTMTTRDYNEIQHKDIDVKHLITEIDHLLVQLQQDIGRPSEYQIAPTLYEVLHNFHILKNKMTEFEEDIEKQAQNNLNVEELTNRLVYLQRRVNMMSTMLIGIDSYIEQFQSQQQAFAVRLISLCVIVVLLFIIFMLMQQPRRAQSFDEKLI